MSTVAIVCPLPETGPATLAAWLRSATRRPGPRRTGAGRSGQVNVRRFDARGDGMDSRCLNRAQVPCEPKADASEGVHGLPLCLRPNCRAVRRPQAPVSGAVRRVAVHRRRGRVRGLEQLLGLLGRNPPKCATAASEPRPLRSMLRTIRSCASAVCRALRCTPSAKGFCACTPDIASLFPSSAPLQKNGRASRLEGETRQRRAHTERTRPSFVCGFACLTFHLQYTTESGKVNPQNKINFDSRPETPHSGRTRKISAPNGRIIP